MESNDRRETPCPAATARRWCAQATARTSPATGRSSKTCSPTAFASGAQPTPASTARPIGSVAGRTTGATRRFEFIRLYEVGEEVVVTYEAERTDGGRFRNTEVFGFAGDKISTVEVYFGWNL